MTTKQRTLVVTWDGAGNLVPTLGIAGRLVRGDRDVRILGHPSIGERVHAGGWRFRPFSQTTPLDSTARSDQTAELDQHCRELWFSPTVAHDVLAELDREPADVLVADCFLYTALIAGQTRLPTVALFHAAISLFRRGPLYEMLTRYLPAAHDLQVSLGLAPSESITDIHDASALSLVAIPREFDVAVPLPEHVRFIGPVLDGPPIGRSVVEVAVDDSPRPLVVVSFSSSYQAQLGRLQQVVDALSGAPFEVVVTTGSAIRPEEISVGGNIRAVAFAAHNRLLTKASVVVTHAGLGTLMAALSKGVPVVCVPMGRDQFFNAAMVERLGVGSVVAPDAGPDAIRRAVEDLVTNDDVREAAVRFAATIAEYDGAEAAVRALEDIQQRRPTPRRSA